jgi:asparagine synthase (glutamine-hydrolysing)
LAQAKSAKRLKTFAIGFDEPTFDESAHARAVAELIGSEHVEDRLSERTLLDTVDAALAALDEPLADPSLLPTYLVSRLAASHVKVVLGGDGGDELFGGYPTYRAHAFAPAFAAIPSALRSRAIGGAIARLREGDRYQSLAWKLKRFALRWDDEPVRRHLRWMSSFDLRELHEALAVAGEPSTLGASPPANARGIDRILALDFATYLPGSVLMKVDRASMAHGLEVRPPLLDDALIDFAFSLPPSIKASRGRTKILLRLAARGHLPDAIIDRPKKGFGIPLALWLRGPLRERLEAALADDALFASGLLRRDAFRGFATAHQRRDADHSKPLWALIVLSDWARRERVTIDAGASSRSSDRERTREHARDG